MKPHPAKTCASCGERYDADVLFCPRDGTPLASSRTPSLPGTERDPYLGLELGGQIRLKHLLGIGAMGRVYCAFQAGIDRDVAVKVLHRELSANPELVNRFHREAKVASRLVHPNVVQVLMTGCVPSTGDHRVGGELYLVMEHLDGISLLSALAAAGTAGEGAALPLGRALHIGLQICDAVGEAHAQGIVHRDLKPENVMLVRRGEDNDYVKVLDFGIARLEWGAGSMATQAGLIFGTAKYISPEGAEGLAAGPTADVYAIATILYQCLAGRTPFEGDSPVALLVQHTHAPPPELRSIARASYVPAPLAAVIMQNLAKRAADRAPNARVLGRDLLAAARNSGLDPEELASSSTLRQSGKMMVKMASKERTRAHELSPELAARIGGVAPPAPAGGSRSGPRVSAPPPDPTLVSSHAPSHDGAHDDDGDDERDERERLEDERPPPAARRAERARSSAPSFRRSSAPRSPRPSGPPAGGRGARSSRSPAREQAGDARNDPSGSLDFDDADEQQPLQSTLQGTASARDSRRARPRARIARAAAILACAAAALVVVVVGGRHYGGFGAAASSDSVESHLDAAREHMRRHAWDKPPQHNVKEVTDRALARWPGDARVEDLRREAAERMVTDALGRKYAGDAAEALHLARLARQMHPTLTTAQHLVAELEAGRSPDVAPAADAGVVATEDDPRPRGRGRPVGRASTSATASPPPPQGSATPTASATAAPAPSASAAPGPAVLPPSPPALQKDHTPPSPASTGPWL